MGDEKNMSVNFELREGFSTKTMQTVSSTTNPTPTPIPNPTTREQILFREIGKWIDFEDLCIWRGVASSWDRAIRAECPEVEHWHNVYNNIYNVLSYDIDVYDQYSYKRLQMQVEIAQNLPTYENLTLPYIDEFVDDFAELDVSSSVSSPAFGIQEDAFISEFYIFLYVYLHAPSPFIKIYSYKYIHNIVTSHVKDLCEILLEDDVGFPQLVYFVPLCYSKHYKTRWEDTQYVNVLCYMNVIDTKSADLFPKDRRFTVFQLALDDLTKKQEHLEKLEKFLIAKTDSIFGTDLSPIRKLEFMTFAQALDLLMKQHEYNL